MQAESSGFINVSAVLEERAQVHQSGWSDEAPAPCGGRMERFLQSCALLGVDRNPLSCRRS